MVGLALSLAAAAVGGSQESVAQTTTGDEFREIETKYLFGFTTGSDIGLEGEKEVSAETQGRFGKRGGRFRGLEHTFEFETTPTQFMQVEFGLLGTSHSIRNVPGFNERDRSAFEGVRGELRYLLIGRGPGSPIGVTASFEPTVAHVDDTTGERLRRVETEFKLTADTELIPNRLFWAVNALYEPEWVQPRFSRTEREAGLGLSTALAYRFTPDLVLGTELRYLRKYEGSNLRHYEGDALYFGPTLYYQITRKAFLSAGWLSQAVGHEAVNRRERATAILEAVAAGDDPLAAVPVHHGRRNLVSFEKHRAKLKFAVEF